MCGKPYFFGVLGSALIPMRSDGLGLLPSRFSKVKHTHLCASYWEDSIHQ
jgi:hypothetical protein